MRTPHVVNESARENRDILQWKESVISKDHRYHLLSGKPLYRERFDEVMSFHDPGLAPARQGKQWFHICQDGKRAYNVFFDRAWGFYYGLAAVNKNGKAFHITPEGCPAYDKRFSWVGNFQQNVCAVRDLSGRYFHIDSNGKRLYNETYRYVGDFKEGYAAVFNDAGQSFHIDLSGKPIYHNRFLEVGQFHKGIAPARDTTGAFHIDLSGNRIYSDIFLDVEPFYNGRAKVRSRDGKLIEIDEEGNKMDLIQSNYVNPLMKLSHDLVGYWKSFLIKGALDLGIFHLLPSTSLSLSKKLNIPSERINLLLMALRERGYVTLEKNGLWMMSHDYEQITRVSPEVLKSVSDHWVNQMAPSWGNLLNILLYGRENDNNHKSNLFSRLSETPDAVNIYQNMMEFYASMDYYDLVSAIDFSKYRTIIDAGGGTGYLLSIILNKSKNSKGYVLDLPSTTELERPWVNNSRLSRISCDIFEKWPVKGDAIILAKVIHDWDDNAACNIISRASESLRKNGSLYIVERLMTDKETSGSILSLHQFVVNGGRERTYREYAYIVGKGGMKIEETTRISSGLTVIRCVNKGVSER